MGTISVGVGQKLASGYKKKKKKCSVELSRSEIISVQILFINAALKTYSHTQMHCPLLI